MIKVLTIYAGCIIIVGLWDIPGWLVMSLIVGYNLLFTDWSKEL